ncbi:hypothetical protein F511_47717 [Dorcoceras hygrometricum]|uniref:Uncharacterized protein n=1 Tax=Dorcoceras hygrometricum TaxID=472368 RepID=A0A2Z6ZWJ5_9LAMI|nr:hypothetical protein F511_47717 [Dorcoceras hygrometricum]
MRAATAHVVSHDAAPSGVIIAHDVVHHLATSALRVSTRPAIKRDDHAASEDCRSRGAAQRSRHQARNQRATKTIGRATLLGTAANEWRIQA